jgi:hypothetical protein
MHEDTHYIRYEIDSHTDDFVDLDIVDLDSVESPEEESEESESSAGSHNPISFKERLRGTIRQMEHENFHGTGLMDWTETIARMTALLREIEEEEQANI